MKYIILLMVLNACGTAGNNIAKGIKCMNAGETCHEPEVPTPTPAPTGRPGTDGKDGKPGESGKNCQITKVDNGAIISCAENTVVILNGTNGSDGKDAPPTSYTVTEMIDPCGKQTSFDEVLLRLVNRQLLAHYASGANQFLTVIGPGTYHTTDGSMCYFTIDNNMDITNEHN